MAEGSCYVKEFELVRGRAHTGKKSWIVSFDGINTLDEARQIVGSAILVKAGDRPNMEEDEIYSLDLVGMRVIVKDTGKLVGTGGQVFNFGAGDLLHVMVGPAEDTVLQPNSENQDSTSSGEHVWIPFAEAIVPDIDMESREMWITPPKGLLELNSRSDKRSKKERRAMEWKEKKKLQRCIIAAKKILSEMDQGHVLRGLLSGDKVQKASLAEQIGRIDFQLFRHVLHSVSKHIDSCFCMEAEYIGTTKMHAFFMISSDHAAISHEERVEFFTFSYVINPEHRSCLKNVINVEVENCQFSLFLTLKVEENCLSPPFIIVSAAGHVDSVRNCLVENDYFGLNTQKVWVLEEMELPIVSISSELNGKKIMLKSPWEILQKPVGPWAIFSLLPSNKILDTLNEMGVEFVQEMKRTKTLIFYFSTQDQSSQTPSSKEIGASNTHQNNPHIVLSPEDIVADPGLRKSIEDFVMLSCGHKLMFLIER